MKGKRRNAYLDANISLLVGLAICTQSVENSVAKLFTDDISSWEVDRQLKILIGGCYIQITKQLMNSKTVENPKDWTAKK